MTALIFDCDGVLAETERYHHLPAFNRAFAELGVPIRWAEREYAEMLRVPGGLERMAASLTPAFAQAHGLPADPVGHAAFLKRLHARKTELFRESLETNPSPARPGVARLMREASAAGWRLAIASTSAEYAVRAVLGHVVEAPLAAQVEVLAGDVVRAKKPAPDIYELALERLGVARGDAIVIEDSNAGLRAACAAGLACIVTPSDFTAAEDFAAAALVVSSLGDPGEPLTVIANRTTVVPRGQVSLADLEAVLTESIRCAE